MLIKNSGDTNSGLFALLTSAEVSKDDTLYAPLFKVVLIHLNKSSINFVYVI